MKNNEVLKDMELDRVNGGFISPQIDEKGTGKPNRGMTAVCATLGKLIPEEERLPVQP